MNAVTDQLLRRALRIDAIGCCLFAAAVTFIFVGPNTFVAQLDVSRELLIAAGAVALLGAPLLWSMSRRRKIGRINAWFILSANAAWAAISCLAVLEGWIHPSSAGVVVIVIQAILTGAIAELEFLGLRRARESDGAGRGIRIDA